MNAQYTIGINADTSKAQSAINSLKQSLQAVQAQRYNISVDDGRIVEAAQAAQILQNELIKATNIGTGKLDLTKLNTSLAQANTSVGELGRTLLAAGNQGQAAFSQLVNTISTAQAPVKTLSKTFTTIGTTLMNTIKWQAASSLIHGAMRSISGAISYAKNLNSTLTDIRVVTGASSDEMARFAIQANNAAKALSSSTNDFAKASLIYYQQGNDAATAAKKAEITTKAANVAFTASAKEMSEMLTAVWNSYQVGNDQLEHTVDIMAKLGATTASSMEEMATGMQKVAATANTVGVSMEQMSAMIATSASVTRQAPEQIGTAWNTILSRIGGLKLGETLEDGVDLNKYSKALETIGVKVLDATDELRSMGLVVEEIGAKWDTLTAAQKSALAQTVGGVRQYTQIMAFFENFDKYQANLTTAKNSNGALQQQQDIWAEGWEAASQRSRAAMEDLYSQLIDEKALIKLTDSFTTIINGITSITKSFGGALNVISLVATTIVSSHIDTFSTRLMEIGHNIKTLFSGNQEIDQYASTIANLQAELKSLSADESISDATRIELEYNIEILDIKKQLAESQGRLTKEQVNTANATIQQLEATRDLYTNLARMREEAEKTANINKENIKNQFAEKLGREAYIEEQMHKKSDPLTRREAEIAYLNLNAETRNYYKPTEASPLTIGDDLKKELSKFDQELELTQLKLNGLTVNNVIDGIGTATVKAKELKNVAKQIQEAFSFTDKNGQVQTGYNYYQGTPEQRDAFLQNVANYGKNRNDANLQEAGTNIENGMAAIQNGDTTGVDKINRALEIFNQTLSDSADRINQFREKLKTTLGDKIDSEALDELISDFEKIAPNLNNVTDDAKKALEQIMQSIQNSLSAASANVQLFVSTVMTIQRVLTLISSVENAWETLTNPDASGLEKITTIVGTLVTLGFVMHSLMSLLKTDKMQTILTNAKVIASSKGVALAKLEEGSAWLFTAKGIQSFWEALGPIGWVIIAITVLVGLVTALASVIGKAAENEKKAAKERTDLVNSYNEINAQIDEQKTKLAQLSDIIHDNTLTMTEQLNKINEITAAFGYEATAIDVLNGSYTNLANNIKSVAVDQIHKKIGTAQENVEKWRGQLDDQLDKYIKTKRDPDSHETITHYDNYFTTANKNAGARSSLFNSNAWSAGNWSKNNNVNSIVRKGYTEDEYLSNEGLAWAALAPQLKELGFIYNRRSATLTAAGGGAGYTAEGIQALYEFLQNTDVFEEHNANVGEGSYYSAIMADLENNLYAGRLNNAIKQEQSLELLSSLFSIQGGNFDLANVSNEEITVNDIKSLIDDTIADNHENTAQNRQYILDYISSFGEYSDVALQYQGVEDLARVAADLNWNAENAVNYGIANKEELQSKIINDLFGELDDEFTIEALLAIRPTDIILDETGQHFTIDEQTKKLVTARAKTASAQSRQETLKEQEKLFTQKTYTKEDVNKLFDTGLFESMEDVQAFMSKGLAERTSLFNEMQAAAIDEEITGLNKQIELANEGIEEFKSNENELNDKLIEAKTNLIKHGVLTESDIAAAINNEDGSVNYEFLYELITNKRTELKRLRDEQQALIDEYNSTDWTEDGADKEGFAKKVNAKSWGGVDEQIGEAYGVVAGLDYQLDLMDSELAYYDSQWQKYLALQDEVTTATADLDVAGWWRDVGQYIQLANNGIEKFTDAMSNYHHVSAEDLVELQRLYEHLYPDSETDVFDIYKTSSESEWRKFALDNALAYYDELARYSEDSEATLIEIEQEKKNVIAEYYDWLNEQLEQSADAFDSYIDSIQNKIELLNDAIDSMDKLSEGTTFGELSAQEINKIKQALLEVGYTAEEVNQVLLNLGKDQNLTDEETIWATAKEKTALLLKELSLSEQGQDQITTAQTAIIQVAEGDAELTTVIYDAATGAYKAPTKDAVANVDVTETESGFEEKTYLQCIDGAWQIVTENTDGTVTFNVLEGAKLPPDSTIHYDAKRGFYVETKNLKGETITFDLKDETGNWNPDNSVLKYNEQTGGFYIEVSDGKETYSWTLDVIDLTNKLGEEGVESALRKNADGAWELNVNDNGVEWTMSVDDQLLTQWLDSNGVITPAEGGGFEFKVANTDITIYFEADPNINTANLPTGLAWTPGVGFSVGQNGIVIPISFGAEGLDLKELQVDSEGRVWLKDAEGTSTTLISGETTYGKINDDESIDLFDSATDEQIGTITQEDAKYVISASGTSIYDPKTGIATTNTMNGLQVNTGTTMRFNPNATIQQMQSVNPDNESAADILAEVFPKRNGFAELFVGRNAATPAEIGSNLIINSGRLNDLIELIQALDLDAPENGDVLNLLNASGFIIGSGSSYQQSGVFGMHLNASGTVGRSAYTLFTLLSNTLPDLDTTGLPDWIEASGDIDLFAGQGLWGTLNWLQELDPALEENSDKDFWKQQIGSMFAGMGYETLINELARGANDAAEEVGWYGANETEAVTEYFNSFIHGLNQLFDLSGLDEDLQTNLAQELQNVLITMAEAEDFDELRDSLFIDGIYSEIFSTLINITDSEGNRIGEYLAEGLFMGFMNNVSAEGYAGAAEEILTILCSVFGIASPSKRTIEMGQYLAQGLGIGLNNVDLSKDVSAFAKSFISTLSSALQEEAQNTGVSVEELMYQYLTNGSNTRYSLYGHGYNFKLNDNNKWVISHNGEIQDGEYESLEQAQNTALATEYVSSKILNEYLQNANSDIEGRTAFQNHVVSKMVNTAIEKFIEEHPEVVDQADSAGQSVLEYVTSHWDDLSGDFVPYFEDAYNNLGKLLETDADEASAKFKDIWKEALVAVVKLEEDEAQRVAEIWESTFEAIGKARLAALKGDSLASTLSDAELKDMARLYLKTNPNASYSELQDFLLHPQKESDVPNFETYNAPDSRSGIAKYLADSSGTSVYGQEQNGQGAYFANWAATYSADATYDAMAQDYAKIIRENLSDTDWMQTIADQFGLALEDMAALDETFMTSHGYTQDEEGNIRNSNGRLISSNVFMAQYSREIADMVMEAQYGTKGSDKWGEAVQESYINQITADTIYLQSLIDQENSELTTLNSELDDLYTIASKMADGTATSEEEATYDKHFDKAENPYSAMLSIGQQKDQNTYQTAINTALIGSGVVQNENGDWMYNDQNLGANNQSAFIQRALMGVNGGKATFNEDTQQYEVEINGKTEQLGSTIDEVIATLQQLIDTGTITDESGFIQGLTPDKTPTLYDYNEEEAYNANVASLSKEADMDIDTITYDSLQLLDQQAIVLEENQHAWEDLTYAQKQSLAEIAAQNYKLQSGMEELRDVTKDTWATLKNASQKGTREYKKAINSMKNIMSKVFNADMDKILEYDADFVEEHLDEMEKMATGTEEEVRAAEEAIQDDLVATFIEADVRINDTLKEPLTVQIDADGPAAEFNNLTSFFQNAFDQWDDMAEVTIRANTEGTEASVIAAMQTILDSGIMTAAQINDALNMIGWEPEIEYQDYVATQQDVDRGWAEVLDINGNIHQVSLSSEAEVGSTVQVPIIKSVKKGPGAAAAPKTGKKGGGSSSGGSSKKQTHDKIKPDKRYQTVDRQLDDQSKLLEKISKEKEKAYGPRYLKYLNEEIKALEKENELYEEKLRQNEQWLSHDLNDLETQTKRLANTLGVNMQLEFDENGEVSNLQEMWEAFQKKYNEFADKEMSDDDFKKYEDAWKEWEESFGQYQETLDTRDDIVQEMQDNLDQISENILEGIKVKAEYRIELNDADIKLLEYYQEKYEDILDKQGELTHSLLMQTGEYLDNAAITAQAIQELNEAFAAGNINEAQYQEEIAAQNENLLDTLKELNEMQDKINEAYENAISLAEESFENQTDNLDHINTLLADYQSIVGLLGKGVDYGYNDKIYQAQIDNNLRMIEANKAMYDEMQKRVDEFEAKREAQGGVLDEADQEHYEAALERAHEYQEEILSEAQDTAQKIQDAYTNMIDNISNKLQESLLGDGESFQHLSDQYATYTEDMRDYLTAAKELSEISKLNREIDKSIEDSTTRTSKERLLALQNEINAKAASNKLTDYDVRMLNLQYQLALKMAALEDAEDAKSVVRLTRDNNGNYAYQYTADEDKVASAQQEYEDVLQQINELAGNRITELEQSFIDAQTEYLDAATQIAQDTALTDEQRAERLEELWRNFQNDMLYLEEQYNNATGQMMQNQDAISAHYGQTLEDRAGQTIAGINDRVQSLIDNVDGFKDAWQEMLTGTGEDDNSILNAAADMGDAIKSLADYAKLTLSDEDIENFKEQAAAAVGAAVDLVGQLGDELDEVDAVTDAWNSQADALDRTINYYELLASSANKALHAVSELDDIATIPSLKDWTFVSTDNGLWPAGGISATDSSLALNQWQTLKTLEEINSDTTLTDEEKQTRLEELEQSYLETQTQLEQNVMIQELNSSFALYADAILGQMQMSAAIIAGGFMGISEILKNKDLSGDAINERAGEFSSLVINADFPNAHDANDIMNAFTQIEAMASQTKNSRLASSTTKNGFGGGAK